MNLGKLAQVGIALFFAAGATVVGADEFDVHPKESQIPWVRESGRAFRQGDCETVHRLLAEGLETSDADQAYGLLASLSELGECSPQDYVKAAELYRLAVENGNGSVGFALGNLYLKGLGVERDTAMARRWFRFALAGIRDETPEERRENLLKHMAVRGGISAELEAQLEWRSELDNDPVAQLNAARMFYADNELPGNLYLADTWYLRSAIHEYPEARYEYGLLLLNGDGSEVFPGQDRTGGTFLRKAARVGYVPAQLELGRRLAYRELPSGLSEDFLDYKAYVWLLRAKWSGANTGLLPHMLEIRLSELEIETARKQADKSGYVDFRP